MATKICVQRPSHLWFKTPDQRFLCTVCYISETAKDRAKRGVGQVCLGPSTLWTDLLGPAVDQSGEGPGPGKAARTHYFTLLAEIREIKHQVYVPGSGVSRKYPEIGTMHRALDRVIAAAIQMKKDI